MPRRARPPRSSGGHARVDHRRPTAPDALPGADVVDPAGTVDVTRDARVELGGRTLRLAALRAHPERYRTLFERARRDLGFARCLCSAGGEKLVIREVAGNCYLARWPMTGDNHRAGCPFFTTESWRSTAGAARSAITVTEHGTRIAVDYAFTAAAPDPASPYSPEDDRDPNPDGLGAVLGSARPRTATVTGLGLVHWLWETASLHRWEGGDRRGRPWSQVHSTLLPVVAGLRLGDQPAPSLLHVVAPYHPDRPDEAREARLAAFLRPLEQPEHTTIRGGPRAGQTRLVRHRRLLLGELKDLTPSEHGHKLRLRHFPRPVFLTDPHHRVLRRRFPAAFTNRAGPRSRRVVLALVEGSPRGYLTLVDAALMLTSDAYLPADSSYEAAVAERLVAARREFTKPLRYDQSSPVLPDFVLTDTDPATVLEVFGVRGREDYDRRRAAKLEHYRTRGTPIIVWDVDDPMPPLAHPDTT